MTRPPLKNVGASVRARLTDYARQRDENAQLVMLRFAIERLIYRLAQSGYRDHVILKGAMLFSLWAPVSYRSTGDLDLLGWGDSEFAVGRADNFHANRLRPKPPHPLAQRVWRHVDQQDKFICSKNTAQADARNGGIRYDLALDDKTRLHRPRISCS